MSKARSPPATTPWTRSRKPYTIGEFHEVILSTLPPHVSNWLRADLPSRIAHLGVPVTTVTAPQRQPNRRNPDAATTLP
jgi:hypothetical protein